MKDLLVSAYKMFKMFMGHFKDLSIEEIYITCEEFFTPVRTNLFFYNQSIFYFNVLNIFKLFNDNILLFSVYNVKKFN